MIIEYLKENILLTDGAMGTYYAEVSGESSKFCEYANISSPDIIKKIHEEYVQAGARLIRTNTFSANSYTLNTTRAEIKSIIEAGVDIAKSTIVGKDVFVGASIGPIREYNDIKHDFTAVDILDEYYFIIDTFIAKGIEIFIFETFSNLNYVSEVSKYIKSKNPKAFILVSFAVTPDGYTRDSISITRIVKNIKILPQIDAYGFNCGSGPSHLANLIKRLDIGKDLFSVLPNASYPEEINGRAVYLNNPIYFSEKIAKILESGAKIIGGCCGTTPAHISLIKQLLQKEINTNITTKQSFEDAVTSNKGVKSSFQQKLQNNEFVFAVELDPPFDTSIEKIMTGAQICSENGIDLITVADSPMAKVRVDSISIASKISREFNIDTMPHICCRDKNTNAIRSGLLSANIEGIRNILCVTGDPVLEADRLSVKSVFNLNSFKLINLISSMNKDVFSSDQFYIGGALNLNVHNKEGEVTRMMKKVQNGATFFLTQPIFDDEVIDFLMNLKRDKNIKILGGIIPLTSYANAQFLNNEIPGIHISDKYISMFNKEMSREESENIGIDIAIEIGKKIKPYVDGLYLITPFNRFEMVMKIYKSLK